MIVLYALTHGLYKLGLILDSQTLDSVAKAIYGAGWLSSDVWGRQWWRALSYLLIHTGFLHLATNLITLGISASMAKTAFRGAAWLLLFVFTGVCAGLIELTFGIPEAKIAGASGAVAGIWGACIVAWLRYIPVPSRHLPTLFNIRWIAAFCLLLPIVEQVCWAMFVPTLKMAHGAHLGGFACGMLLGLVLPLRQGSDDGAVVRGV